nr:type II toxin-antitoxin system Phd/YefM family antitoxin [Rickettsia massiliae]
MFISILTGTIVALAKELKVKNIDRIGRNLKKDFFIIAISQFKSHCLAIIEKLQTDKESIIITKRDKEVAQILPINTKKSHYSVC